VFSGLTPIAFCSPGELLTFMYYPFRKSFPSTTLNTEQTTEAQKRKLQCKNWYPIN
jgi:hypothetical protein